MNNQRLVCAWLSWHEPTAAQRKSLAAYRIVQINPTGRYWSPGDAWALAQTRCGGVPDLVVAVMPTGMLKAFLRLVDRRVPVVRAVMDFSADPPIWTGQWEQIVRVSVVTTDWTPGSEVRP